MYLIWQTASMVKDLTRHVTMKMVFQFNVLFINLNFQHTYLSVE